MKYFLLFLNLLILPNCFAQKTIKDVLKQFNTLSVPYISVSELKSQTNVIILDARETKEFNISHLKNAQNIGFEQFDGSKFKTNFKNQNATFVVYCSIGVRSEKIGEKLLKLGYKNVFNLFGGIFEWKNQGEEIVDNQNKTTDKIHTFSKEWSKYSTKGIKIY